MVIEKKSFAEGGVPFLQYSQEPYINYFFFRLIKMAATTTVKIIITE